MDTGTLETNDAVARANAIYEIEKRKKNLNFNRIPLDDKKTWDMICSGMTKGVFQVEKQLGKRYCKEIAPRSIDELSDVLSLIRPGCLEAEFREKPDAPGEYSSITNTYIKIKHGVWDPEYIHSSLEPILNDTFGVLIYQEQIMRICTDFAGFTLKEADVMRKAVGKKQSAEVFAKLQEQFVNGAVNQGHDRDIAETIFGWIQKFSGYGFNKSHGISYAMNSYRTAYAKANYPLQFFKAMLTNSDGKQDSLDEIQELVHEARYFGIDVRPPCLRNMNTDFIMDENGSITFGIGHIKGVGKNAMESLENASKSKDVNEFLRHAFALCPCCKKTKIRSNVAEALIKSGAMDYLKSKRIPLLAQYRMISALTARERKFVFDEIDNGLGVAQAIEALLSSSIPNKSRRPRIVQAFNDINKELGGNTKRMCIAYEKYLLGIPLSGSLVELYYNPKVDIKCANLSKLPGDSRGNMGVVLEKIKFHKDKNHNDMAFLTVSDETYFCDNIVVFASTFRNVAWILEEGRPVLISGKKSGGGGFIANKIEHL